MESILFFVFWLTKVDSKFKRVYVKFILWWQYDHCSTVHQTPDQDSHASHTRTENNEWVSTWRSYFNNLHTLRLVGGALWRLTEFHVLLQEHESSELLQHGLDCVVPRPPGQDRHRPHVHHAVAGHAVHVDPVYEPHGRGLVGVVVPALCTATMWTFYDIFWSVHIYLPILSEYILFSKAVLGGPMIMPVQHLKSMSSSFSRPQLQR